jgi:hypothetical protein
MRGTMIIMVPTMTNLTGNAPMNKDVIQESKFSPVT